MRRRLAVFIIIAGLAFGCQAPSPPPPPPSPSASASVTSTTALPDLSLYHLSSKWRTQDGATIGLVDRRGYVQVVALVYASCQGACPRLIADMRTIEAGLTADERNQVRFLLVSIDPDVDTPTRLQALAIEQKLGPAWTLLNGRLSDVQELAAALDFKYRKISLDQYAHSNIITVLSREGVVAHQQNGLGVDPSSSLAAIREQLR